MGFRCHGVSAEQGEAPHVAIASRAPHQKLVAPHPGKNVSTFQKPIRIWTPFFWGNPKKKTERKATTSSILTMEVEFYIFTWLNLMMWWCVCLRNTPTESWDLKTSHFVLKILKQNDLRHSIPSVYLQVSNEIPWLFWYGQYYLSIFGITRLHLGIIMLNNYQHPGSLLNHQNN